MYTDQPALQLRSLHRIRVLLPVGSCEQHGPHLPVDTDLRIAQLLVDHLAHQFSDEQVYVLPALPFSCSWEHKGAGMIALSTTTFAALLHDIARSLLTWNTPLVLILVNWHGGNTALGSIATEISMQQGLPTFALPSLSLMQRLWQETYGPLSQDVHAGAVETAIVQAFWPTLVSSADPPNGVLFEPTASAQIFLQAVGLAGVSSNGVWGYPQEANAEQGRKLIAMLVNHLKTHIDEVVDIIDSQRKGDEKDARSNSGRK